MKINLSKNQKQIRKRLLETIYKVNTSHIGSCVSVIDIIDAVYTVKKPEEKFVLSNGHAAAALYIILEKNSYLKNPDLNELGVHPDRNPKLGIDVSTGSLGQGLPIALGMALANRKKNVYCLISDGECAEGSIWESLRVIHDLKVTNIKVVVSVNGWGAYDPIDSKVLLNRYKGFGFKILKVDGHNPDQINKALKTKFEVPTIIFAKTSSEQFEFLKGLDAHYCTMKNTDYELVMEALK